MDEFLRSKLVKLMSKDMFYIVFHPLGSFDRFGKFHKFWQKSALKICAHKFQNFQIVPNSLHICGMTLLHVVNDHIFSQTILCTLKLSSHMYPQLFLKLPFFSIFHFQTILSKSSSGWVLTIRKVLPSKSMSSEEYFKYLSCTFISNRSEDIFDSISKNPLLVSYNSMHHVKVGRLLFSSLD